MDILPGTIANKYKFEGIGKLNATVVFMWLAQNVPFLTVGIAGKIVWYLLVQVGSGLASTGVVLMNVGVAKLEVIAERDDFKGTIEEMIGLVDQIGPDMTKEKADEIDNHVIDVVRKFIDMSR